MIELTEKEKINKGYVQYQHSTQGIDIWEEGAYRGGWRDAKEDFIKQFENFYFDSGEDWHLWDEDEEKKPYPITRQLDAMKKFLEKLKKENI